MANVLKFFTTDKTKYFYSDQSSGKRCLVNRRELEELVAQGVIRPETPIETISGQKIIAREISDLFAVASLDQIKYIYFDQTNTTQGPYSRTELDILVAQGFIGPHTLIETPSGEKGTAEGLGLIQKRMFQSKGPTKNVYSWLAFISKFAAFLGTAFAGIWSLGIIAKFTLLLVIFLGLIAIVVTGVLGIVVMFMRALLGW